MTSHKAESLKHGFEVVFIRLNGPQLWTMHTANAVQTTHLNRLHRTGIADISLIFPAACEVFCKCEPKYCNYGLWNLTDNSPLDLCNCALMYRNCGSLWLHVIHHPRVDFFILVLGSSPALHFKSFICPWIWKLH